jgi:N-acetylglucosamine-6-phosphate deacetylase
MAKQTTRPVAGAVVTVLTGARVVTPTGVVSDGFVELSEGRIVAVGSGSTVGSGSAVGSGSKVVGRATMTNLDGGWLLPGFIDLHMHGGGGHDVTTSAADTAAAVAFHRTHGTTRTLVWLMAQPVAAMIDQLGWLAAAARNAIPARSTA